MTDKPHQQLHTTLATLLGEERVITGQLPFYSSDIFGSDQTAALLIRPDSSGNLAAAIRLATEAGYSVIGRGGATSYTGGLNPDRENSVIVDTSDLNRIIEINPDDMYVTVECGVTWQQLHEALKDTIVRTPFWGPLSGGQATIGGSLSQNAILLGSTAHDVSATSVLSLEVATADGALLNTGSAAVGSKPFFRNYGPDLTGLFLGDCGALGIKTRATLRLMRRPAELGFASFNYDTQEKISSAMVAIAQEGVAATCFGMDPMLQYQRIKRASMLQGVKALKGVIASSKNTFSGIRSAMRIAVAGKRFIDENGYSLHIVVEGADQAEIRSKLGRVKKICLAQGSEIESSIPSMMLGDPFVPMTSAIGPAGERWAPMHGLFPLSEGYQAFARIEALFDGFAQRFDQHNIIVGYLLAAVSSTAFVIEPVFYWPGPKSEWSKGMLSESQLGKYQDFADDPDVTATIVEARDALNDLFDELGAAHLQIGKKYRYSQNLQQPTRELLEAIKNSLDPSRLINPKTLGL